jgi:hypothetical protein
MAEPSIAEDIWKFADDVHVKPALERCCESDEFTGRCPSPCIKLSELCRNANFCVASFEKHYEPFLPLPSKSSSPCTFSQLFGNVVKQPVLALR